MSRTVKQILRKAEQWRQSATTSPGAYRLYVYVPWEEVPEEIKPYFNEDAQENWDNDIGVDNIETDIELQSISIINEVIKRNTVQALMFIPMLFADLYMLGLQTNDLEAKFSKLVKQYSEDYQYDHVIADMTTVGEISSIISKVLKRANVEPSFDLQSVTQDIINMYDNILEKSDNKSDLFNQGIDAAIEKYKEVTGKDLLEGIDTGELTVEELLTSDTINVN